MLRKRIVILSPYTTSAELVVLLILFCSPLNSQNSITLDSLCHLFPRDSSITNLCQSYTTPNQKEIQSNKLELAKTADSLGLEYLNSAKYIQSQFLFGIASDIWQDSGHLVKYSNSLIHLGRSHYRQGNIFISVKNINEGIRIARENQNREIEGLGHLYLSWNYWRIRQCDEALNQLLKLKGLIDSSLINKDRLGEYYNARSKFEFCLGNTNTAFIMADSAIQFARANHLLRLESVAMSNKVNYFVGNNNFEEQLDLMQKAIKINKALNDTEQLGSNLALLGQVYLKAGLYKESLEVTLQGLAISKKISDKPRILRAHDISRRAYVGLNDFANAYFHERDARLISDSIYDLGRIDKIFDLQKAIDQADQDRVLMRLATEKEIQSVKIAQERKIYGVGLISLLLMLGGGIWSWLVYKKNKEKETQLIKEVLENEMKELELQSLRALMNPHFIFNSLNSIKGFIIKNKPSDAANYLNKFSHLIRLILSNSQKPLISLTDELKALEMYIQLEGLRLEDKFDYSITIEKNIHTDSIQVAPMIIQPFVENAIWHGLMSKNGVKSLHIEIKRKNNKIEIVIKDNGVGRLASQKRKENSGVTKKSYGMQITENRIKFAQQENAVLVKDLFDDHQKAAGTEVVIQLNTNKHDKAV